MNYAGTFEAKLSADGSGLHSPGLGHVETIFRHATHAPADAIIVPDAQLLFNGLFKRSGVDLILSRDDHELVLQDYFKGEKRATLASPDGAHLAGDLVNALTGHTEYAQADGSASAGKVIGHVTKLTGTATATRNGVSILLHQGDNVEKGDVVQSGSDSTLGVTFIDGTVFGLSSNARMVLNEMVYDPNGSNNSSLISLVAGTISFVAGETAKHGDMKVDTPVATMGIRGTAVLVEIDFTVPGGGNAPDAKFQVLVEPDGHTGSYILFDKNTLTPIATVNQAGQQINISQGQVTVTNAPLPPDIQKLINDVFTLKFTDANPKTFDHFTDSVVPVSLQPIMLANGTTAVPIIINVNKADGASNAGLGGQLNLQSHIPGPPLVVAADGALIERLGVTHSSAIDTVTGSVNFVDVNAGDHPTVSITFGSFTYENAQHKDVTNALSQSQLDDINAVVLKLVATADPANNNSGSATWTYSLPDSAFDFMAKGETLTLTYIARVDNNFAPNNETGFKSFTITITTGANDVPTISTTSASFFELSNESQPNPTDSEKPDVASGSITFADVDLTDRPTVTAAFASFIYTDASHTPLTLTTKQHADVVAVEAALKLKPDAHNANAGTVDWSYSLADRNFDFLAAGEILTLTYLVTVDDGNGGTKTAPITIEITGTNDTPTVSATTSPALSVKEDTPAGLTEKASGSISFADVDLSDTHIVSAAFLSSTNADHKQLGSLTATETHDTADGAGGAATWNYSVDNSAIQFLAEGQQVQETFAVTVDDGHGGKATQNVVVTIIGTNDDPTISATTSPTVSVKEDTPGGVTEKASGTISFADVDLTDTHTISAALVSTTNAGGPLGTLTATEDHDTAGGIGGTATWNYVVDNSAIQFLAEGQQVQETFAVTVDDGHGGKATQNVVVTIIGTNDAPDIHLVTTDSAAAALTETNAGLSTKGTLTVNDVDLTDTVDTSVTTVAASGTTNGLGLSDVQLLAMLKVTPTPGLAADPTDSHNLNWTFDSGTQAFDYLAAGQSLVLTYTVKSTDSSTSPLSDTQTITITITGTNDAPDIHLVTTDSAVVALNETNAGLSISGTLTENDPDVTDTVTSSVTTIAASGAFAGLLSNAQLKDMLKLSPSVGLAADPNDTHNLTWTFNSGTQAFNYLAVGQSLVLTYTVKGTDSSASPLSDTQKITVTINGTNDAPTIIAGSTTAKGAFTHHDFGSNSAHGVIAFADADLSDSHIVSVGSPTFAISSGTLTTSQLETLASASDLDLFKADSTGVGFGFVGWDYSLADRGADLIGGGRKLTVTYAVTVADGHGGTTEQDVVVTVTGINEHDRDPAGVAGSAVNLGLAQVDGVSSRAISVTGAPPNWTMDGATHNADGSWTAQTNDFSNLTMTPDAHFVGASLLHVTETWTNSDGSLGSTVVSDNIEAFAPGAPIFAVAGDDHLTGSATSDLFVFAQPIGNDTIYNFNATMDKIDLVAFDNITSFADIQGKIADDGNGNSVITLGAGETITLKGVHADSLTADDFVFNQTPITENAGAMQIGDGAHLAMSGTIHNTGAIELNSAGETTGLLITGPGVTLTGAGHVILSDSLGNLVVGTSADVVLTNVDNRIDGAGDLGGGQLSIVNAADGIITATSATHQLTIDTGVGTFTNHGSVLSAGQGGLEIKGNLVNDGVLEASAGLLTVDGDISGGGHALIDGGNLEFGAASDAIVQFSGQVAGTLHLDDVAHFTGSVSGFSYGDSIDLAGIDPALVSIDRSGSLEIHYGTGANDYFSVGGNYDPAGFTVATDHHGGTEIVWNDQAPVIDTEQVSLVQNIDGTIGIAGLQLLDSDSSASETLTVNAATETGSSVKLAASSGHLSDINAALDDVIYDPGLAPSTARIAITVADSLGATDKVNFIFNDAPASAPVVLQGTADKDVIFGSAHGDILTGGGGQDQFVFAPTSGTAHAQHTITDFVTGLDKIDLRQFGNISSLNDLAEAQQGNDTLITLDSHDSLLLKNVGVANLSANDFILHPGGQA